MTKRNLKFVNKTFNIAYDVTAEEMDVLNKSYEKEKYQSSRLHAHNKITVFTDYLATENSKLESQVTIDDLIADENIDIENQYIIASAIAKAITVLDADEKSVIELMFFDGYSLTDIQELSNHSYGNIVRTKNRALRKMKKELAKNGYVDLSDFFN